MASEPNESAFNLDLMDSRGARAPVSYRPLWVVALVFADILMFVLAGYVAGAIVDHHWDAVNAAHRLFHSSIIFIVVWLGMFYLLGLYRRSLALSYKDEFYFTVIALIIGVMPQLLLFTLVPQLSTSRLVLLLSTLIAVGLVGASRSIVHVVRAEAEKRRPTRVLLVGHSGRVNEVREEMGRTNAGRLEILTLDTNLVELGDGRSDDDKIEFLLGTAANWKCDYAIVVDIDDHDLLRRVLSKASDYGIKIAIALPKLQLGVYETTLERKGHQDLLVTVRPRICRPTARLVKRIFDIVIASIILLLCSPIILLASLLILLDSGKPILFRQERVGRGGRIFSIFKLRTMRNDADSKWAKPGDPRITRFGGFLRRTSIDELPQLFNVLLDDMSLVGPRPEMRVFEERFANTIPSYAERRLALPGITGWAQVCMKRILSEEDAEQVLSHDLFYIEHWSVFLDLTILLKTAAEFLFQRPA